MTRLKFLKPALVAIVCTTSSVVCRAQTPTNTAPLWAKMQMAVLVATNLDQVKALVKQGFDINSPIGCGTFNALDGAVQRQQLEMVEWLLANGAKPKGSALLCSARCSNQDNSTRMVAALLKAGADANFKEDYPNPAFHSAIPLSTPLLLACYNDNRAVVKLLLNQPGIELDTICIDNDTPLMLAAKKGAPEIVALLLAAGADPNVKNKNGETAISLTANHPQIQNQITQFLEAKKSLPK